MINCSVVIELRPARECEVVSAFLKAELDSPEYSKHILPHMARLGLLPGQLIDNPDLDNEGHNLIRLALLDYRGFRNRQALFYQFPTDVRWRRVELESNELGRLKYICKDKNWMSFSENTRRPSRVAQRIANYELLENPGKVIIAIQEKLRQGERLPELIVAEGTGDDLILIEGHKRATAYVGLNWPENIPVFLGSSPQMHKWHWF